MSIKAKGSSIVSTHEKAAADGQAAVAIIMVRIGRVVGKSNRVAKYLCMCIAVKILFEDAGTPLMPHSGHVLLEVFGTANPSKL